MNSKVRLCFMLCTLGSLAACGEGPVDLEEVPEPVNLTGVWDFTEVIIRSTQPVVCRDTGSFRISVAGSSVRGTGEKVGTCSGLIGSFADDKVFSVIEGVVSDTAIEFVVPGGCGSIDGRSYDTRYVGTISRGPPVEMIGRSACSVTFNGSWEARPAGVVASLDLLPDSANLVVDETIHLTPVLASASGARLFERSLAWSSDDAAVASVSDEGVVVGTGIGTTGISVGVSGLEASAVVRSRVVRFGSVSAGMYHTCGITDLGETHCWGANEVGQSGPAPSLAPCPGVRCRRAPGVVPTEVPLRRLAVGGQSSCGLGDDGRAYCWGSNAAGQLGADLSSSATPVPLLVTGGMQYSWVHVGIGHACAVASDGTGYCWGYNNRGQVGPGAGDPAVSPQQVSSDLSFASVYAGSLHSCGLSTEGVTYCWGWNWDGQLGNDTIPASADPIEASNGLEFEAISVGMSHNCGITADGEAYCWGDGERGQLGIDSVDFNAVPTPVATDLRFELISAGAYHTCALTAAGSAYCWGEGESGRLGNGSSETSAMPAAVSGDYQFATISAGGEHTCGMTRSGEAYCWGSNYNGQLGQASTDPMLMPRKVVGQR